MAGQAFCANVGEYSDDILLGFERRKIYFTEMWGVFGLVILRCW